MEILFLQTAEATYRPLLEATSQTVREYCARHRCNYESFFGVIRGYHPWHATYNRIPLLKRLVDVGYEGWVCYIDADAYICDLGFNLREYLSDKDRYALIIAPGSEGVQWWRVNAGVFLINLGHRVGRAVVRDWSRRFDQITDEQLRAATWWSQTRDDQSLLQDLLQELPDAEHSTLIERGATGILGRFVKQVLRVVGDLETRTAYLRRATETLLGQDTRVSVTALRSEGQTEEAFVRGVYRVLLMRDPEPSGLANGVKYVQAGMPFEGVMRSVLSCEEFRLKRRQFTDTYMRDRLPTNNLTMLANKLGSDKGTQRGAPPHKYTYLYDLILDQYRHWAINLLELGLAAGGPEVGGPVDRQVDSPSVHMWLEYFPHARVFGFDISDFSKIQHPRFTFIRGDGGSRDDMERLARAASGFDIIIDDGSHASYHQQLAFKHLFPKLRRGGTYIIEDLQWQSPSYEGKPIPLPKTRDFMINFFENDKYVQNDVLSEDFMRAAKESLASHAWFPAFSGGASPAKVLILRKAE
jgi:hypothetical protein